jgi:hypothetical protein
MVPAYAFTRNSPPTLPLLARRLAQQRLLVAGAPHDDGDENDAAQQADPGAKAGAQTAGDQDVAGHIKGRHHPRTGPCTEPIELDLLSSSWYNVDINTFLSKNASPL